MVNSRHLQGVFVPNFLGKQEARTNKAYRLIVFSCRGTHTAGRNLTERFAFERPESDVAASLEDSREHCEYVSGTGKHKHCFVPLSFALWSR